MNSLEILSPRISVEPHNKGRAHWLIVISFLALTVVAAPTPPPPLSQLSLLPIYSFPSNLSPEAGLLRGKNGNFYVTALSTVTNGYGAIFEVTPQGAFSNSISFHLTNGAAPLAPLTQGGDGNLYGTTSAGGISNNGSIFKIAPSLTSIIPILLFTNTDGAQPYAPLAGATNGLFYGTTSSGGAYGLGTIFEVNGLGVLTNLFSFDWTNGANPYSGLIQAKNGVLYGTTRYGGADGLGTIFAISLGGNFTNLISFYGANGADPRGLAQGSDGNFYGVTFSGGAYDLGTVFEMTPSNTLFVTPLNLPNGTNPDGPLLEAADGAFYGAALQGGMNGFGAIFRFVPSLPAPLFNSFSGVSTNTSTNALLSLEWVSFDGIAGAYPYGGLIQGTNGDLYGTASYGGANNTGAIFDLTGFAPVITKSSVSENFASLSKASFSVVATGSAPLTYQWQLNGAPLTNGTNTSGSVFSGAATASLTINNEAAADVGTYSVIVSNPFGAATNSAELAVSAPALAVKPPPPSSTAFALLPVSGTAADKSLGVAAVQYQLGTTVAVATTANQWTNWSAVLSLQPGSNLFQVWGVDPAGNFSKTNSYEIFYYVTNALVLSTHGSGKITAPAGFNADKLIVGKAYTLTAAPAAGNLFSNWTGSITTSSPSLTFLMASNMVLTANFVTNIFQPAAGVYNGLFYQETNAITPGAAGMLSGLTVNIAGAYSGRLLISGSSFAITGKFDSAVEATNTIARNASGGGPVTLTMYLDLSNGPPSILGTVSALGTNSPQWTARLTAQPSTTNRVSAEYTILIQPAGGASGGPPGTGYALVTNHLGVATITGALADGTAFTQTVPVSDLGDAPVYASLYSGAGLLLGWITNIDNAAPAGTLAWVAPSNPSRSYSSGFTNLVTAQGSPWTNPPARTAAISLSDGSLTISGGFLAAPLDYTVSVNTSDALVASPPGPANSLTGSINAKTGLLTLSFGNGDGKAITAAQGAILQNQSAGAGFFTTKTNAGSINLQP